MFEKLRVFDRVPSHRKNPPGGAWVEEDELVELHKKVFGDE